MLCGVSVGFFHTTTTPQNNTTVINRTETHLLWFSVKAEAGGVMEPAQRFLFNVLSFKQHQMTDVQLFIHLLNVQTVLKPQRTCEVQTSGK